MENKVNQVLGVSMDKIREMAESSTVIGEPIRVGEDMTILPISKVSYGFAGGGSDLPSKTQAELFGGGTGAGISVTPVAMLIVQGHDVRMMPVTSKPSSTDEIIHMVPDLINRITQKFSKDKE